MRQSSSGHIFSISLSLSVILHGALFINLNPDDWAHQSKGQAQLILLAPNPNIQHPKTGQEIKATNQQPNTSISTKNNTSVQKTPTAQPAKPKPIKSTPTQVKALSTPKTQQTTASLGDQVPVDVSSNTSPRLTPYGQQVLNYLLSKMEESPVSGQAIIKLKIIRAGVAIQVDVVLEDGPETYLRWVRHKALSANPYPPIPDEVKGTSVTLEIPIRHTIE